MIHLVKCPNDDFDFAMGYDATDAMMLQMLLKKIENFENSEKFSKSF